MIGKERIEKRRVSIKGRSDGKMYKYVRKRESEGKMYNNEGKEVAEEGTAIT